MTWLYLPKPIYEILPLAYVVGGLAAAAGSDGALGVISGLALAVAGLHVRNLRIKHRKQQTEQRAMMEARLRRYRNSRAV